MPSTPTPHRPQRPAKPPTARQLQTLRQLALTRGQSFVAPKTMRQASREIDRLIKTRRSTGLEQRRERDLAKQLPVSGALTNAASVRDDEVTGYGSTARWAAAAGDLDTAAAAAPWDFKARRARAARANKAANRRTGR